MQTEHISLLAEIWLFAITAKLRSIFYCTVMQSNLVHEILKHDKIWGTTALASRAPNAGGHVPLSPWRTSLAICQTVAEVAYRDLSFQYGGRPPSSISYPCVWTTREKHLVVFIVVQNFQNLRFIAVVIGLYTPCVKKRPTLDCYNFETWEWILIFLTEMLLTE